jgi:hypothetical protein
VLKLGLGLELELNEMLGRETPHDSVPTFEAHIAAVDAGEKGKW